MRILLISSGSGEWPNNGWGACENLTADFYWALGVCGAEVDVLHSSNLRRDLLDKVNSFKPDLVHCEYDDHVAELELILLHFPRIKLLLTTHYAYLSQPYRLIQDGYMYRFLKACELAKRRYLHLAVLSEEIAYTYTQIGGVPSEQISIFPNGTRVDKIRYAEAPRFPERAICLGKIEDRKNQYLLQSVDCLDFVGPISDDRFDSGHSNYKGKWTRDELYTNLTNYACLVLCSKAEAHPLVIGEALAAGCSVVCNKIASANLPVEMPWICVIEDEMIQDPVKIKQVISNMCKVGIQYRSEIRAWSQANLDWRVRAKLYLAKWFPSVPAPAILQDTTPLKIALVGPGIMPIPPTGWGAVEQLVWDYCCFLKKKGHTVDIINTPNRAEILAKVGMGAYDVCHVHYDVFWDILDKLEAKLVCITSHYPYIEKSDRWRPDGYDKVFAGICDATKKGAKLFALSKKDRDMYVNGGVQSESIFMMPNGVDTDSIRLVEEPHFKARSVVLAKVEPRKRQNLTFGLGQVDYIGRGPCSHPNYRGEIEPRSLLMNILTDWGNFVLLSDGENGTPLVVKEAMAAGLGCVLSESAAYELPKNLGWVQVVPECDLNDPQKINDAIEMNRSLSLPMRKQIREWIRENWDWSHLVDQYVSNLKSCLEKCC